MLGSGSKIEAMNVEVLTYALSQNKVVTDNRVALSKNSS